MEISSDERPSRKFCEKTTLANEKVYIPHLCSHSASELDKWKQPSEKWVNSCGHVNSSTIGWIVVTSCIVVCMAGTVVSPARSFDVDSLFIQMKISFPLIRWTFWECSSNVSNVHVLFCLVNPRQDGSFVHKWAQSDVLLVWRIPVTAYVILNFVIFLNDWNFNSLFPKITGQQNTNAKIKIAIIISLWLWTALEIISSKKKVDINSTLISCLLKLIISTYSFNFKFKILKCLSIHLLRPN